MRRAVVGIGTLVGLGLTLGCARAPSLAAPTSSPDPAAPASTAAPSAAVSPSSVPQVERSEIGEAPSREAAADPAIEAQPEPAEPPRVTMHPGGPELEITRRVRTGVQPKSVTLSPDGSRLYVCNFGLANHRNVYAYETEGLQQVGRIDFPGNAVEVATSSDGQTLYVSNFGRGVIEIVDAQTLEVTAEVEVDNNPKWMVVDEVRRMLYVSNWSSRSVSAVDLQERAAVRRLHTGRRPRGMALLEDGTLLVGAMWDHRVQAYSPGSTRPDHQFEACENPRHLVLSPDQRRLYVSCSGDRLLRWFDPRTGEVLGEAPTGLNPRTIDISRDGRWVAIADFSGSTVTVVDTVEMTHRTHELPRTKQIVGLAVAPGEALTVYATSWLTNQLLELRPAEGALQAEATGAG